MMALHDAHQRASRSSPSSLFCTTARSVPCLLQGVCAAESRARASATSAAMCSELLPAACQSSGHKHPCSLDAMLCRMLVLRGCKQGAVQAGPQHDWLAGRLLHAAAGDAELLPIFSDSVLREGFLPRKLPPEAAAQKWVTIWQEASEPERQALQVRHCCSQVTGNAEARPTVAAVVVQPSSGFSKAFLGVKC